MSVKQISVFIENKKGKLAEATRCIADHNINLKALSIADTQDFGILRFICENPQDAEEILKKSGYLTKMNNVLAVVVPDEPGSLARILETLAEKNIIVEYMYAFLSVKGAVMILRVNDNGIAESALTDAGLKSVDQAYLF